MAKPCRPTSPANTAASAQNRTGRLRLPLSRPPVGGHRFDELQLTAAALLVEAATMDSTFDAEERARVSRLVQDRFALSAEEARAT